MAGLHHKLRCNLFFEKALLRLAYCPKPLFPSYAIILQTMGLFKKLAISKQNW